MINEGNSVIITSRNKDVSFELLNAYGLKHIDFGKGTYGGGALGKILYLIYATFKFFFLFIKKMPSITISFSSSPLAIVSWMFRVPHISFDDTEHAKLNRLIYSAFTPLIISPASFYEDLGDHHCRFNGYMELFYLHKNRFTPNSKALDLIGLDKNEPYTLFRFVSWEAFHDIGQKGLNQSEKIEIVLEAKKYGKVFISSEGNLPKKLKPYELNLPAESLHDILFFSSLYVGEGGTTASECAMIGTPSIYINSLPLMGYLKEVKKNKLLYHLNEVDQIKRRMKIIYNSPSSIYESQKNKMLKNTIDPTEFLIWLIKNYPESKDILLSDPIYQNRFQ
tara:strand:- start:7546 stop:8553 length:1008 start_codon:yes stop_codon:yes gene_type:complete